MSLRSSFGVKNYNLFFQTCLSTNREKFLNCFHGKKNSNQAFFKLKFACNSFILHLIC